MAMDAFGEYPKESQKFALSAVLPRPTRGVVARVVEQGASCWSEVMSQPSLSKIVKVINPEGLHLRPAGLFAQMANQFDAKIEIIRDGDRFDGKSALSILTLVAEQGTELRIEAQGPDANAALGALVDLVEQGFPGPETAEQT